MARWQWLTLGATGVAAVGSLLAWLIWIPIAQAQATALVLAAPPPTAVVLKADDGTYLCAPPRADGTRDCSIPARPGKTVIADSRARTPQGKKLDMQTRTAVFRLQERAQLELRLVTNDLDRLLLAAGRLFVSHDPDGRDKITVDAGTIRVDAIDTRFTVVRDGTSVLVAVPRDGGTVTVTLAGGAALRLSSGQQLTFVNGVAQGRTQPISTVEQNYWTTVLRDWATIPGILPSAIRTPQRLPTPTPIVGPAVAPVQVAPADGASISSTGTARMTFTWQPVNYPAVQYGIEIEQIQSANPLGTPTATILVASTTGLTSPTYTLTIPAGLYRWRVWAIGPTGAVGPKSAWRSLNITTLG